MKLLRFFGSILYDIIDFLGFGNRRAAKESLETLGCLALLFGGMSSAVILIGYGTRYFCSLFVPADKPASAYGLLTVFALFAFGFVWISVSNLCSYLSRKWKSLS